MNTATFNEILHFIGAEFRVIEKLPASGQRTVFTGKKTSNNSKCIIKTTLIIPVHVARIQREIRILESIDSNYFPKFYYSTYITTNILEEFYESFDITNPKEIELLRQIRLLNIRPFLITIEEFIEHIPWNGKIHELKIQQNLVEFLLHVFTALNLLWDKKIVHRDLKPDNILLREDLRPVIIDLGIAKSFRPGTQEITMFQTPCTPRYAAPEQLKNNRTEITYKTDQFAIGVVAFNILTGKFPYGDALAIGAEILDNFEKNRIDDIRNHCQYLNESLANLINKLLQPHPHKRFRQVSTILQKLHEIKGELT